MNKIFVSYNWEQQNWLQRNLIPLLDACGYEVLVDYRCFTAGKHVLGQMDDHQDQADLQILLMSEKYLTSANCQHEMKRAIDEFGFDDGKVIPVCYEDIDMPDAIKAANPLWVGPLNEWDTGNWGLLGRTLFYDLGVTPDAWVQARIKVINYMMNGNSVNLVTRNGAPARPLIESLAADEELNLGLLNFEGGLVTSMPHLVRRILRLAGISSDLLPEKYILAELEERLEEIKTPSRQAWLRFSYIIKKSQQAGKESMFNTDFFATVRSLAENRKLNLLLHSHQPVAAWLEKNHELSHVDFKTVEL